YSASYHIETVEFDDGFTANLPSYQSWLTGTASGETLSGSAIDDTVVGRDGNDTMYGAGGADKMHGGNGDDILYGDDSLDVLYGGDGADTLYGGNHMDTLTGGDGDDTFMFEAATAFTGEDTITDFGTGADVIDITDLLGVYDPLTDDIADFVSLTEASGDTLLQVDTDGTGGGQTMRDVVMLQGTTGLGTVQDMIDSGQLLVA
ncbi:MAG: type I secretion C-terminal target domain-containing protein, partial [Alphaproteobacteria bacterium]|nr:type I secretion C-terminal target domain-containing protein [Alphaproteobacteria bacterium]